MSPDEAEVLALKALTWLAGNEDLLAVFLNASGASAADLHAEASNPAFLCGILDFLTMDDAWVMAFTQSEGVDPHSLLAARSALPGGEQPHWT